MHDKLQPMTGALFALPDLCVITLEGRDAAAFAQAQFINDVNDLQPDSWQWSGWLTPKGRLIVVGTVAGAKAELDLGLLLRRRLLIFGTVLRSRPL